MGGHFEGFEVVLKIAAIVALRSRLYAFARNILLQQFQWSHCALVGSLWVYALIKLD